MVKKFNKPILIGLHIKKNGKLPSIGETIMKFTKASKIIMVRIVAACVRFSGNNRKNCNILNEIIIYYHLFLTVLWSVEEPLPVHRFKMQDLMR